MNTFAQSFVPVSLLNRQRGGTREKTQPYNDNTLNMGKIVVIGSANTDLVINTSRIPEPGETVLGGQFMMAAGGKGANQAVAAQRLGGDVTFVACVGDDLFGKDSLEGYRREGMNTSFVSVKNGVPSGVATIVVDSAAENVIVVAPGANSELGTAEIDAALSEIEAADFVLMQLETPMETVEYAAGRAFEAGTKVVLNPAPAAQLSPSLLSKLWLITPNRTETQLITGLPVTNEEEAAAAAEALVSKGVKNVVITLGSKGAYVLSEDFKGIIPANPVKAVDTTAAGDTFNGALCVALSEGMSLPEACRFAAKASAIAVTRMGAQPSIPFRREIAE